MAKRILFLHGLESGPNGSKVESLRKAGYEVCAPQLDTSDLRAFLFKTKHVVPPIDESLYSVARCSAVQAIEDFKPDILVGSSFGGGLAATLINDGVWVDKPTLLLAPAAGKLFRVIALLGSSRSVGILHGIKDEVVPIVDSIALTWCNAVGPVSWVDDGHRLKNSHQEIIDMVRLLLLSVEN